MSRPYLEHSGFRPADAAEYEDERQIRSAGRDVVNKARELRHRDDEQLTLFLAEVQAVVLRFPVSAADRRYTSP